MEVIFCALLWRRYSYIAILRALKIPRAALPASKEHTNWVHQSNAQVKFSMDKFTLVNNRSLQS